MMITNESLKDEIIRAEANIRKYARCYDMHENECPADFKLIMLINNWHSPFEALYGLLKRIRDNETSLKKRKIKNKSISVKMERLIRNKGAIII